MRTLKDTCGLSVNITLRAEFQSRQGEDVGVSQTQGPANKR